MFRRKTQSGQFVIKRRKPYRYVIFVLFFLLVVIGIVAVRAFIFSRGVFKSEGLGRDILSFLPLPNPGYTSDVQKAFDNNKTINVLLVGYGGAGHDGPYLTDSMLVVRIDPQKKNVALISIPRDLWVQIPETATSSSYGKINSAYAIGNDTPDYPTKSIQYTGKYGGGNLAKAVVSNVLGIPIDYFVGIDFAGFQKVVDDLGGVDINVTNAFDDYQYPSGDQNADGPPCVAQMNTPTSCQFWHVHFSAGLQHMDGQTALEYARSRHAIGVEGTDFARSQRQQKLLVAIKDKALQINALPNMFSIMNSLQDSLITDMTIADMKDLAGTLKDWNIASPVHAALTNQNFLKDSYSSDGQYILLPKEGLNNYTNIQEYIANIWDVPGVNTAMQNVTVHIVDNVGNRALAAQVEKNLTEWGIQADIITNPSIPTPSQIEILDGTNNKYPDLVNVIRNVVLPSNLTGFNQNQQVLLHQDRESNVLDVVLGSLKD